MKVTLEKVSHLTHKMNVEIPAAQVKVAFDKVFQVIQKQVALNGFRKGKVPLNTIKSMYAGRVKQDVAEELIQAHYHKAISEKKIEPVNDPEFQFTDPKEASDFKFSAEFEIRPEVVLKKYEGLPVTKEIVVVEEEKIEKVLENIRASRAIFEDIIESRPAQLGDFSIIDFEGFVDGKPLENGSGKGHQLNLGAKEFIDGFEDGILGMSIGDVKNLHLTFPTPYQAKELEGKPVEFKVTLQGLKKRILPELTNEFLKTIGGPADVESLKQTIREDLKRSEQKKADEAFKNNILKALVEANPVAVPVSLLKSQKELLINNFKKQITEQGLPESNYEEYAEKWGGDFEKTASDMIQANFLVDEIARKHNLYCNEADLDQKILEYAKQTGLSEKKVRDHYSKPEQLSRLAYMITEEKVIGFLKASIVNVN